MLYKHTVTFANVEVSGINNEEIKTMLNKPFTSRFGKCTSVSVLRSQL